MYKLITIIRKSFSIMIYKMRIEIFDTNNQVAIKIKFETNNNNYYLRLKIFKTR